MAEQRMGHYGLSAIVLAGLAVLALVLHLATPYANVAFDDGSDESFSRSDIAKDFDFLDEFGPNVSPALTLAGVIVAAVGAITLAILGFAPLRVEVARWAGWGSGVVTAVGASMAFVSSMWWVGSGFGLHTVMPQFSGFDDFAMPMGPFGTMQSGFSFVFAFFGLTGGLTGLMELMWGSDSGSTVWIISPFLVAAISIAIMVLALRVCGRVAATRDGIRERTQRHLRTSLFSMVFVGIVLLVPWAIGETTDSTGADEDYFAFGAHTIVNMEDMTDGESFGALAYAIKIMVATAWIGFAFGIVGSAGGILASSGAPASVARGFHLAVVPTVLMYAWSLVLYLLTWIYMWRPFEDAEGWQPGYVPAVLIVVFGLWGINLANLLAAAYGTLRNAQTASASGATSFD